MLSYSNTNNELMSCVDKLYRSRRKDKKRKVEKRKQESPLNPSSSSPRHPLPSPPSPYLSPRLSLFPHSPPWDLRFYPSATSTVTGMAAESFNPPPLFLSLSLSYTLCLSLLAESLVRAGFVHCSEKVLLWGK